MAEFITKSEILGRLDRLEAMVTRLCEAAGVRVERKAEEMRAWITTDEGGHYWWDVEATKARALGLPPTDLLELGARVSFFLAGWMTLEEVVEEVEKEAKRGEAHTGQYL